MRRSAHCLIALLALASSGCANGRFMGLAWPQWGSPGGVDTQRNDASLHDPYPDPNAGPEVVGGRPREFQKPLPEPVRNRWLTDSWWQR